MQMHNRPNVLLRVRCVAFRWGGEHQFLAQALAWNGVLFTFELVWWLTTYWRVNIRSGSNLAEAPYAFCIQRFLAFNGVF